MGEMEDTPTETYQSLQWYKRQTTYTMGCVSVEHHRTRGNNVSKLEHVTDVIESVRRRGCLPIRVKLVSRNE